MELPSYPGYALDLCLHRFLCIEENFSQWAALFREICCITGITGIYNSLMKLHHSIIPANSTLCLSKPHWLCQEPQGTFLLEEVVPLRHLVDHGKVAYLWHQLSSPLQIVVAWISATIRHRFISISLFNAHKICHPHLVHVETEAQRREVSWLSSSS